MNDKPFQYVNALITTIMLNMNQKLFNVMVHQLNQRHDPPYHGEENRRASQTVSVATAMGPAEADTYRSFPFHTHTPTQRHLPRHTHGHLHTHTHTLTHRHTLTPRQTRTHTQRLTVTNCLWCCQNGPSDSPSPQWPCYMIAGTHTHAHTHTHTDT